MRKRPTTTLSLVRALRAAGFRKAPKKRVRGRDECGKSSRIPTLGFSLGCVVWVRSIQRQVQESDTIVHAFRTCIAEIPLQLPGLIFCVNLVFYHYAKIVRLEQYVDASMRRGVNFCIHSTAAQVAVGFDAESLEKQPGEHRALAMQAAWVQQVGENGRVRLHLVRFAIEDSEDIESFAACRGERIDLVFQEGGLSQQVGKPARFVVRVCLVYSPTRFLRLDEEMGSLQVRRIDDTISVHRDLARRIDSRRAPTHDGSGAGFALTRR